MASEKQLRANQLNAKKSTGPKTEEGKAIVALNALQHGILSQAVIEEAGKLGESKEEFALVQEKIVRDLAPFGFLEEMLAEKIIICYWRLRRVVWAENGQLRLQTGNLALREIIRLVEAASDHKRYRVLTKYEERLKNSVSARWLQGELTELKKTVEETGYLSQEAFDEYAEIKNLADRKKDFEWVWFFNKIAQGEIESEPDKEKGKKALLDVLNQDIEFCQEAEGVAKGLEKDKVEATSLSLSIPTAESAERLLRYETALENQLYKAMNQLLKLQILREGGRVVSLKAAEVEGMEL